jgi:hypothetical protein
LPAKGREEARKNKNKFENPPEISGGFRFGGKQSWTDIFVPD